MRKHLQCIVAMVAFLTMMNATAFAGLIGSKWVSDHPDDSVGGPAFESYGIGYALDKSRLYFRIGTNLPETGEYAWDSYGYAHISPGDLYINIGGDYYAGTGSIYGLAFTTHTNCVEQAYSGDWEQVVQGRLYQDAVFADGTLEEYEYYQLARGITPDPPDHNPYDGENTYPSLISGYGEELTGVSNVRWLLNSTRPWDYDVVGYVETAALGLDYGESFQIGWSYECGNDAVGVSGVYPIPEPTSLTLIGLGVLALGGYVRKRGTAA